MADQAQVRARRPELELETLLFDVLFHRGVVNLVANLCGQQLKERPVALVCRGHLADVDVVTLM
jgi:hypothetical protein